MNKYVSESFPGAIDFGFCVVHQNNTRTFQLTNHTKNELLFDFDESAFTFEPRLGKLNPKSSINITVSIVPSEAIVIVANTVLNVENEPPRLIKISAIGKYPFISLSAHKLDFETILIGKKTARELIIKNQSQVPASFEISQIDDDGFKDTAFSFDITRGEVPAKSSFQIKVVYEPKIVFLDSVSHFRVNCTGGNILEFECKGSASGYDIQLSTKSIDFGDVQMGKDTNRLLTIQNVTDLNVPFQFYTDKKSVFGLSVTEGIVKAKSTYRIIITFVPQNTMNYYERIFCMIPNSGVHFVDLIGNCFDLLIRPKPIKQRHIDIFRHRIIDGKYKKEDLVNIRTGSMDFPKKLLNTSTIGKSHIAGLGTAGLGTAGFDSERQDVKIQEYAQETGLQFAPENSNQVVLHKELMLEHTNPNRLITISQEALDFGYCDAFTLSQQQEIEVTNNLFYKVTLYWMPVVEKAENGQALTVFSIYPQSAVIKPKASVSFSVKFRPPKNSSYYFQKMQYFAVRHDPKTSDNLLKDKKNLQTTVIQDYSPTNKSTLIIEDEIQPPISGSIPCVGHSFSVNSQTFIPIVDVSPSNKVYFRPCSVDENVYSTLKLMNKTDTPIYYKFLQNTNKAFRVFPQCGIIEGNSFNLVTFEFSPKEVKNFTHSISCCLNHNMSDQLTFKLYGYCFEPKISLQNEGQIFFPPSFIGVASKQKYQIHNLARVPLEFKIEVPAKYENELIIKPNQKILKPNEIFNLLCSFAPFRKKEYKIKVPVKISSVIDPLQSIIGYHLPGSGSMDLEPTRKETSYDILVFGHGGEDSLDIQPKLLDFGIVKVNYTAKETFTLENFSDFTVYVKLSVKPTSEDQGTNDELIKNSFKLDFTEGIIAGKSKISIGITFTPVDNFEIDVILECAATEKLSEDTNVEKKIFERRCFLQIKAQGNYPKLKICDVRNDSISVSTLWENFSINKINKALLHPLSDNERKYNTLEQLTFEEAQSLQKSMNPFDWNFGYVAKKQPIKPRRVVITIENIGGTDLDWKFNMPSDSYVATEPWADPGEPTDEEAFEKAMIEREIFEIKPRSGKLQPKKTAEIQLSYSPSFDEKQSQRQKGKAVDEEHYLKVVLHILNGKPVPLLLKGTTLAPSKGLLAVKKSHHVLPSVPIGSLLPVMYPIEMQNVGSGKISYRVDTSVLDNYSDAKIKSATKLFDVSNPSKTLDAGSKSYLYCLFKPLEAKKYQFKLPIIVSDFVGVIHELEVTLEGSGYNTKPPKEESQIVEEIPNQRSEVSEYGSKVFFSIEELDFGEVESSKPQYRLVLLYNDHKARRLQFKFFSTTGLACEDLLEIEPNSGYIEPKSFVQLKITLVPSNVMSFYEGEIECAVIWSNPEDDTIVSQGPNSEGNDKEFLFLRLKKKSKFADDKKKFIPLESVTQYTDIKKETHLMEIIMTKVINDVLNDPATDEMVNKISKLPVQLYPQFDKEEPANIKQISPGLNNCIHKAGRDLKEHNNQFFEEEFVDLVDTIMESTFFNLIQQATLKEIDLLKPSKIYLSPV